MAVSSPFKISKTYKKYFISFKLTIILFLWFFQLNNSLNTVRISYFKNKKKVFYYSKAPMAHKTNSHEKYYYRRFSYLISVRYNKELDLIPLKDLLIKFIFIRSMLNTVQSNSFVIKSGEFPVFRSVDL